MEKNLSLYSKYTISDLLNARIDIEAKIREKRDVYIRAADLDMKDNLLKELDIIKTFMNAKVGA